MIDPWTVRPDHWEDEEDGEWQPRLVSNKEFRGDWKPRKIDNPNYQGVWEHPLIKNRKYKGYMFLYRFKDIHALGIDIWQVKAGTLFDNLFLGDDMKEANEYKEKYWRPLAKGEKKMHEKHHEKLNR